MAYTAIDPLTIEVGDPVKKEILDRIRDNQESFNTDIEALKQTSIIDIFNLKFAGSINEYNATQLTRRLPIFKAPVSATIVAFKLTLITASTSGTLEVSIERSSDNGVNWTPLLNNPVQLTGTTVGSTSSTVDWVDIPSQSFSQGDLLRLVVDGVQVDQGEFQLHIYGELS